MKAIDDAHELEYGKKPEVVAKAPGRFHLAGEYSWFFRNKTLSMAINLPVYVSISKRDDSSLKCYFCQYDERKKANLTSMKLKKEDKWANTIKAVAYGFTSGGYKISGMDITIYSEILPSAGFGITTGIKAAFAIAVRKLFDLNCNDVNLLQVIERANRLFLKTENFSADNYAAFFAKKGNLIITDYYKNKWDYIPFSFPGKKIFLIDTKVPRIPLWNENTLFEPHYALILGDLRESKDNVYGGWRYIDNITDINESLSELSEAEHRKLMGIIKEHNDIMNARDGVESGDFFKFARAVNHSHETLREHFDISCPETEWILKRISEFEPNLELIRNPVTCGRITGKGYGRCVYTVIRDCDVDKLNEKLSEFEKIFGFHPVSYEVECADGASIVV